MNIDKFVFLIPIVMHSILEMYFLLYSVVNVSFLFIYIFNPFHIYPCRYVNIEVDFVPFSEECLVKDPNRSVLQQPIFHTYWTDCTVSLIDANLLTRSHHYCY